MKQAIDQFARDIAPGVRESVYKASKLKTEKRMAMLQKDFEDADELRRIAGEIKQHTLEHLGHYLEEAEHNLVNNGAEVHWAANAEEANRHVLEIMRRHEATRLVKSKSMVSEETHLVPYLEKEGIEAIETDLGEYIVQIDGDHPSHIVTPIVHKSKADVARSFEREGLGPYTEDPPTLTRMARNFLRRKYLEADLGLTGGNFVVADTGQVAIVTNEGNARFSMAATRVHIAMIGIEKLIPSKNDLPLFLSLLARSATGQPLTVYNQLIGGPRADNQVDGPEEMHVIFLDNGRSEILEGDCREILRCIRCGACLNVCPIYRQTSGHAYRSVYPGPVGAVLSPLLQGKNFPELADLPKASSLCGACNEVCPVNIPIPDLLLRLRNKGKQENAPRAKIATPDFKMWSFVASNPGAWRTGMQFGHALNVVPHALLNVNPAAKAWQSSRELPKFRGGEFRRWVKQRKDEKQNGNGKASS